MKRIILNLIFVLLSGILMGQNQKPTFYILSVEQNRTAEFIKVESNIKSILEDRGLVVLNSHNLQEKQFKSDYNIFISIQKSKDSIGLNIEIIENCWETEVTSAITSFNIKDVDISEATLGLCDEICADLMEYFDDMFNNGQAIKLSIKSSRNLNTKIKTKTGSKGLYDLINEFVELQSIDNPEITQRTDSTLIYKLKIPVFDNKKHSVSALTFATKLKKHLKSSAKLNSQITQITKFNIELDL